MSVRSHRLRLLLCWGPKKGKKKKTKTTQGEPGASRLCSQAASWHGQEQGPRQRLGCFGCLVFAGPFLPRRGTQPCLGKPSDSPACLFLCSFLPRCWCQLISHASGHRAARCDGAARGSLGNRRGTSKGAPHIPYPSLITPPPFHGPCYGRGKHPPPVAPTPVGGGRPLPCSPAVWLFINSGTWAKKKKYSQCFPLTLGPCSGPRATLPPSEELWQQP